MASVAIEKLTERYFYPHPYAYPIIGSAENLKESPSFGMCPLLEIISLP